MLDKNIERGKLLSSKFIATITKNKINSYFPERKELRGNIDDIPKYDIDLYKVTYSSIYQERIVELSGLIVIPKRDEELILIQYHHGTLLPYPEEIGCGSTDAPSLYEGGNSKPYKNQYETRLYGNYLASYGYLLTLPDYPGYGVSEKLEHPYSCNLELAENSVDMILATREFIKNKKIILKEKICLAGWSEGGAVAVATQKLIESEYKNKIKLLANAPMSALLNSKALGEFFLTAPKIKIDMGEQVNYLAWLYYSYNKFSSNPISFDELFKIPVSNELKLLKDRNSNIPSEVFKPLSQSSLKYMIKQARKNNLAFVNDWKPVAPLFIHHGTADTTVQFLNNVDVAVKNYREKGGNAKLIKYEGHNHGSLALLQLKNMIEEFEKLKNN